MPCMFLPHFLGSSFPFFFFLHLHLLLAAQMKQMPLEIRWAMRFPTSCSGACSGLEVKILSKFHGGLAHFPQSNCSTVLGTMEELGQLATEATSGPDSETRPDNNEVGKSGNKTVSRGRMQRWLQRHKHSLTCARYRNHKRSGI